MVHKIQRKDFPSRTCFDFEHKTIPVLDIESLPLPCLHIGFEPMITPKKPFDTEKK